MKFRSIQSPFILFYRFIFVTICLTILVVSCSDNSGPSDSSVEITSVRPDSGIAGTSVQIYSNSIAPKLTDNHVFFNDTSAEMVGRDVEKVTVRVPGGATSGPITLEVAGYTTDGPYFKILTERPVINAIAPCIDRGHG